MFYLLVLFGIVLYYFFMAPKSIRSTINSIGIMVAIAILLILAGMSFMKLIQSPGEVYIIAIMLVLGFLALRDILKLSSKDLPFKKDK
ncbi:DUF3165 family protein [Streptococcus pluranimalium]|uniref:DUF3165 domain-containing protein n=1 Tax=Streptococcus pluranimalium TaxID=82348 RepID=A0A2L0D5M6_9STRE|nr:DUF3165 family protein [Streptococcus pluranimalium]AUW96994.1 DUF3165 domain-containing protein [Streptococcus pluranimalium]